ncbi:MAG: class I SAM-dependent methyltransferase [[Clostridium] scindens]
MKKRSFDLVIANHVLFYCEDIPKVAREVKRVLKRDGRFVCSTYGCRHMMEVSRLVQGFDERIVLVTQISCMRDLAWRMARNILGQDISRKIEWMTYRRFSVVPGSGTADLLCPFLPWQSKPIYSGSLQ